MAENMDEIAEALAAEMGIGNDGVEGDDLLSEFFNDVEESRKASAEVDELDEMSNDDDGGNVVEERKWVHEPTGREFDNELDYLRYNSGWTADRLGSENKELRQRLERLEAEGRNGQQHEPPKDIDVMKKVWDRYDEDVLKEPYAKFVYDGLSKLDQGVTQMISSLKGEVDQLKSQLTEERELSRVDVPRDKMQKLLEKHPGLGKLPLSERVAVIKDMLQASQPAETQGKKLASKIPQRNAADHVEGSVNSEIPTDGGLADFEKKVLSADDSARLGIFGKLFEESEFGRSLSRFNEL